MKVRIASAALAAVLMAGSLPADAEADHRKKVRRDPLFDRYYMGPVYIPAPRALRFIFGGYEMPPDDYAGLYGDDGFDESYYDPQVEQPVNKQQKKPAKAAAPKPAVPAPAAKKPATAAPVTKSTGTGPAIKTASISKASGLSCSKAGEIVSGYGFTGVKPADCDGQVYAFNATRDGKSFAIKLNAASGELTEVIKLQ